MLQQFKNIIWDWNGTLLNDAELCVEVINEMLQARNLNQINKTNYQELFQFPISAYYEKLGFNFAQEPFEKLASEYVQAFDSRSKNCALHTGAMSLLKNLKANNTQQFILSAHEHHSLLDVLDSHALLHFFTGVYGIENCQGESKIHRGKALFKEHNLNLEDTVLIGDTDHDLAVAKALDIQCILIANGHHSFSRLRALHKHVYPSLNGAFKL